MIEARIFYRDHPHDMYGSKPVAAYNLKVVPLKGDVIQIQNDVDLPGWVQVRAIEHVLAGRMPSTHHIVKLYCEPYR